MGRGKMERNFRTIKMTMKNYRKAQAIPFVSNKILKEEENFMKKNEWRRKNGYVPNPKRIICMTCGGRTHNYGGFERCNDNHCGGGNSHENSQYDIEYVKDGNMWNARMPNFINLQESISGFGNTPLLALKDLKTNIKNGERKNGKKF